MRFIIFLFFLSFLSPSFGQSMYSADDYFNASNPSAFAEKLIYTSNSTMIGKLGQTSTYNNFFSIKQRVKSFSFGLNNEYYQWDQWKVVLNTVNGAYSMKINRNLILNSGIGLSMHRDNMTFVDSAVLPISNFTLWNPTNYSLHVGFSLVGKKSIIGISANNLNRATRITYPYSYQIPISLSANASYRIDLDSAKHFSFTPSLYYQYDVDNHYHDVFLNLNFRAFQHSIGIYTTFQHNLGLFYQFHFKNHISIGASLNNNYSLLSSNIFNQNYLSGMLRLSYAISPKVTYRTLINPSF